MIVLWGIEGFSSRDPPPPQSTAPTAYDPSRLTRSAFSPSISPAGPVFYTRILEFDTPGCGPQFFMRFRLHCVPDQNQVLAFCNANGRIFFWDFERLRAYHDFTDSIANAQNAGCEGPGRPSWLQLSHPRRAGTGHPPGKPTDSNGPEVGAMSRSTLRTNESEAKAPKALVAVGAYSTDTVLSWESKYNIDSPHRPLKAHKVEAFGMSSFVGRQVGWSPGGEWCVVVGSSNVALILQRW